MELKVTFTGICAFVENADTSRRCKTVVLLPDGARDTTSAGKALDGCDLRRHRAYIKFKARTLKGVQALGLSDSLDILRYLMAERVTVRPTGTVTPLQTNLSKVANLDDVIPGYSDLNSVYLGAQPPLAAQVLLENGSLTGADPQYEWSFPNTVSAANIVSGGLSHEVVLTIPALTSADLLITRFNSTTPEIITFVGEPNESVEVTVANLCDTNPLRWKTINSSLPPDDDFRWYYQLVARPVDLERQLFGLNLPVPFPVRALPNGQGMNCLGGRMRSLPFDLDSFLP